jgi:hypothetical protein
MSDITLDFTVNNTQANFTVTPTDLTVTVQPVNLTFSAGGLAVPNGPQYAVQYNKDSQFTGSSDFVFNYNTSTLSPTNLVVNGGTYLANANITANVANMHILGGTNGYVLQTDGAGNLNWTTQTGGGGNGSPGGADTQVQFNDGGVFGGNVGFTFNKTTGNLNISGNIIGNVTNANYANFAGNVAGANVTGQVANALIAGTVYTNAQPNITSVGNLTTLTVIGNSNTGNIYTSGLSGNITGANVISANTFIGNTQVSNITSYANISITTAGARVIINNGNTTTFRAIVGGGGSNIVPIFYDGTNWRVG